MRSTYSGLGVVHVTENELPEVLEESGMDYELTTGRRLSGRTITLPAPAEAVSPNIALHSPSTAANLRRFRRAVSEPVQQDQVTSLMVEESKLSLPLDPMSEAVSTTAHVAEARAQHIPPSSPSPHGQDKWGQQLPDGLPYMDDSSDPASVSESAAGPTSAASSLYKSFNGAPTTTTAPGATAISGDAIHGIQTLGRNLSGGWL